MPPHEPLLSAPRPAPPPAPPPTPAGAIPPSPAVARSVDQHFEAVEKLIRSTQETPTAGPRPPALSVVVPVYNETHTVALVVDAIASLPIDLEIIAVDDGSSDGSRELLAELARRYENLTVVLHETNRGKGAALQSGFARCRGEVVIVQDADLEYDPRDIPKVVAPIHAGLCDAVYGSRYLEAALHEDRSRLHRWGNAALTGLSNLLTGQRLTDMETCYKAIRRPVLQAIEIEQRRFGFEPEITAKLSRRGVRIAEVGVRYTPRSSREGKKIGWRDLVSTLFCIVRYRF